MVRLVFRPYTQLRRSICTSESLRSSTRVSPGFNLARHSSPSFGSQQACSFCSAQSEVDAKRRGCQPEAVTPRSETFAFAAPLGLEHPMTRTHVRLLGPCFKTGRRGRRPTRDRNAASASKDTRYTRQLKYPLHAQPRARGSNAKRKNFTPVHGELAAVRRVKYPRNAAARAASTPEQVVRSKLQRAATPST